MVRRLAICVAIALAIAVSALAAPEELARRRTFPKPSRAAIAADRYTEHATLKLVEGSGVRLRGGRLVVDPQAISDRLKRTGIDREALPSRVAAVNAILARYKATAARQFSRGEQELDDYRAAGEKATKQELGDQNLFYILTFRAADDAMVDALEELNRLDVVERASPMPKVTNPVDKSPTTPLLTGGQGYLGAAPTGINVNNMGSVAGGLGQNITIVDIEYGWTTTHEDLKTPVSTLNNYDFHDHGTAVLGELVGIDNGYGIRGIAHGADTRVVGHHNGSYSDVADAIDTASGLLSAGDIILMETQHYCFGTDLCPSEYYFDVFAAVQNATANGRVVVSAAGNGGLDLDHSRFNGQFDPNLYDSGAILVGAGTSTTPHNTLNFSNYGARVNVQGWGHNVTTTGYGDLFTHNGDPEQEYTATFGGTSSASPIVTGAAAVLQGIRKARGLPLWTSTQMRAGLQVGATAQGSGGHIGPLPNVQVAAAAIPIPTPAMTATGFASWVSIAWPAVPGISHYELYKRTTATGAWTLIYNSATAGYADWSVSGGATYAYRVRAIDNLGNASAYSDVDLATTINYSDSTITSFVTPVKGKHMVEVRTAVNAICTFATSALCATLPYSGNDLDENYMKTQRITSAQWTNARTTIEALRSAVGAAAAPFRETTPQGAAVKRIHMEDLRTAAN